MTFTDIANTHVANVWGEEVFYEIIKKCLDKCFTGETVQYEGWMDFPGRGRKYYSFSHHPYFSEQGHVTHAAVALCDMTQQKLEEELLERSRAYFKEMLKHVHFGVYTFDTEARFTYVNDVVVERTGYPREWFIERSLFDFVRAEEADEVRQHFEETLSGKLAAPYEFSYSKVSGEICWVQVNTTPMWEKGDVVGVLGLLFDVTKRKKAEQALYESEQKFRAIINGSPTPQFIIDKDHTVTIWNKALERISGIEASQVEGTREHWKAFYKAARPCIADLLIDEAYDKVSDWYDVDSNQCRLSDGVYTATDFFKEFGDEGRWLHFAAAAIRDTKGNIIGAVETLQDITEQKLAEETIKKTEDRCRRILQTVAPSYSGN